MIEQRGLDPAEFNWQEQSSVKQSAVRVHMLTHSPTGYYFIFEPFTTGTFYGEFSPGPSRWQGNTGDASVEWDHLCKVFVHKWLGSLKQELTAPNLWEGISEQRKVAEVASSPQTGDTPFTREEQEYIAGRIGEIKQYLSENLPPGQIQAIGAHLDELVDASRNMGRREWMIWTVGTIVNTVIQYGIQSNVANQLLRLVYSFFGHLLTGGTPPLQLGA